MTTTVAFATRECIVLGCDSLGTLSAPMLSPFSLLEYFERDKETGSFLIKRDSDGNPILNDFDDIYSRTENIPVNQLPTMSKLFSLYPANCGVLFAGSSVVGESSIKEHIRLFVDEQEEYLRESPAIVGVTERLNEYFSSQFSGVIEINGENYPIPLLELTVAGYSGGETKGEIYKIYYDNNGFVQKKSGQIIPYVNPGDYNIIFGGQYDVAQRIINGLDPGNIENYKRHIGSVVDQYADLIRERLGDGVDPASIPSYEDVKDELGTDSDPVSWLVGSPVDLSNFSEQAAIDLVDFLIASMIKTQHFSNRLQTVGGDIHIALLTKNEGMRMISREEYVHAGHSVPKTPPRSSFAPLP